MAQISDPSPLTAADWLRSAERRFRAARLTYGHGTHAPGEDAAWLLTRVLKTPHERLGAVLGRSLTERQRDLAERIVEERIRTRKPMAYLLKEAWLGDHRFYVDERVIVPRSFIAELLRDQLAPWIDEPKRIRSAMDMCTGSGCLSILLALAFPRARVNAVDIDARALAVARRNVRAYGLEGRLELLRSDAFDDLPPRQHDLIVSNPPYVDAPSMARLPQEYRHEPRLALESGRDGLDFTRRILRDAPRFLRPDGVLIVEIGHNRRALERAFPATPFTWLDTSAGEDFVFLLARKDIPTAPGLSAGSRLSR
jgi:ribosomal protein L3 glutamine methyltransferase